MERTLIARPELSSLTFVAFDRPLHPEMIDSLTTHTFRQDGFFLRVSLTSAGHALEWRWQNTNLVELLVDDSLPLPEHRQLFGHRIGGERTEQFRLEQGVTYAACFQVERMPPHAYHHFHDELRRDGQTRGVIRILNSADRLGLSPLSFVDLQYRPGSLLVHVFHTYPEQYAIVKSQTLIEFPND